MNEAMRQVRDTLGDDAIIVNSREEGGWIKITAAVEQINPPIEKEEDGPAPEDIAEIITEALMKHRAPANVSDKIISVAMTLAEKDPQKALAKALQRTFSFEDPAKKKKCKPIVLVGPPGAGKTLMAAKLAAREVLGGRKAAVITTDIARAGGVEQLSAFLDILSLSLAEASDTKSLKEALANACPDAQVIIDTGGLNPFDPQEMKALAKLLAVAEMEPTLVLPAGIDTEESAEMAMTFGVLGVKRFMPTRLDFARRLGSVLNTADRAGLPFMEASHTPQVAEGILTLTPEILAGLLMPHSPKKR